MTNNATKNLLFTQIIDNTFLNQENNFDKPLKWLSLVNQGSGVPIYWLLNGSSTLKKHLPDNREIYKINTHYDKGKPNKDLTIELICNEFSEEILKVNRGKHCIIGGFSIGAMFAYETAQQLKKAGITVDLLILLDPSEKLNKPKDSFKQKIWIVKRTIKTLYYLYTQSSPPDKFQDDYVFQFYRFIKRKYKLSKYNGKVLLIQRRMNVDFEHRDWPKIVEPSNLLFSTLEIDEHLEVVHDSNIQLEWINKIKEYI